MSKTRTPVSLRLTVRFFKSSRATVLGLTIASLLLIMPTIISAPNATMAAPASVGAVIQNHRGHDGIVGIPPNGPIYGQGHSGHEGFTPTWIFRQGNADELLSQCDGYGADLLMCEKAAEDPRDHRDLLYQLFHERLYMKIAGAEITI